jgi:tetratricopeptide (TPR) repeat protein
VILLRRGLGICPDDHEARLALAGFYVQSGNRARGLALLVDALGQGLPPPATRDALFSITAAGEDWETALRFAQGCLASSPADLAWAERQGLIEQACTSLLGLDRPAEALALAAAEGGSASPGVQSAHVRALLALQRPLDAVEFLDRWLATATGGYRHLVLRLRAEAWRQAGRYDEMDRTLDRLRALNPGFPQPHAYAVEQKARAGQGAAEALEDYLFRFGGDPGNLHLVLQPLAEIPDPVRVRRVVAAAAERGYPTAAFRSALAMALLRSGDWEELERAVAGSTLEAAGGDAQAQIWHEWIRCLASALTSRAEGTQQQLIEFIRRGNLKLDGHRLTVTALRRAGREEAAREVIAIARRIYAESPWMRRQEAEVNEALAAAAPLPDQAPPIAPAITGDWEEFRASVDAAVAVGDWSEARRLLRSARNGRPAPDWLGEHEPELAWWEMRVAQAMGDRSGLEVAARRYITGDALRALRVVDLARGWHAAGGTHDGRMLLEIVIERSPGHGIARAQLGEWQAAEEAATARPEPR